MAADGRLVGELASPGGVHGASADGTALRGPAQLPPQSDQDSGQNHSQAKGDASHHDHVTPQGRDSDGHGRVGRRRSGRRWGPRKADRCINMCCKDISFFDEENAKEM